MGSGKSEILRYLKSQYKCRILMSDNAAKDLELPGGVLYEPLIGLLEQYAPSGEHEPLVLECGEINKTFICDTVVKPIFLLRSNKPLIWNRVHIPHYTTFTHTCKVHLNAATGLPLRFSPYVQNAVGVRYQ